MKFESVCVYDDGTTAVLITKEKFNGVCVQLVCHMEQLISASPSGGVRSVMHVIDHKAVSIHCDNFKEEVVNSINKMKQLASEYLEKDKKINGLLNDFKSQFKDINCKTDER